MSGDWNHLDSKQDQQFRVRRAALLEYARSKLPTRFSRNVLRNGEPDEAATPTEIWLRGDWVALLWYVRHKSAEKTSPIRSVVGVLHQPAQGQIEFVGHDKLADLPSEWKTAELIDFSDAFWPPRQPSLGTSARGARIDAAKSAELVPQTGISGSAQPTDSTGPPPHKSILKSKQEVDDAFAKEWKRSGSTELVTLNCQTTRWDESSTKWKLVSDVVDKQRVAQLLEVARVCNFRFDWKSQRMVLFARKTPFYKGCQLFRLIDMRGPRSRFTSFVVHFESIDIACLFKKSAPIYDFNKRRSEAGELLINTDTVAAYLRFFCEFVQGDAGAFSIIEQQSDIRWLSENSLALGQKTASTELKDAIIAAIEPVALYRVSAADKKSDPARSVDSAASGNQEPDQKPEPLFCRAMVGYDRHLFVAGFSVKPTGEPEMFVDRPLIQGPLPIQPLNFNYEFQFELRVDAG